MDPAVAARLAALKPIYDEIAAKTAELADLEEAEIAGQARELALRDLQQEFNREEDRLKNWKRQLAALKRRQKQPERPVYDTLVNRKPAVYAPYVYANPPGGGERPTPPPPPPQEDRVQLARRIGRYLGYRLSNEERSEFNRLLGDPRYPIGQALAGLDWQESYATPLHARETPEEWVARLDQWGAALQAYLDDLSEDVQSRNRRYRDLLPILARWRGRQENPAAWEDHLSDSRAALRGKIGEVRQKADEKQKEWQDLQQEIEAR